MYLVAAVDEAYRNPRDYSPNKFLANLGTGQVREATQEAWDLGLPLHQTRDVKGQFLKPTNEKGVLLEGRVFPKSGPQWPISGALDRVSPDGKWIAVQSWDGKDYGNGDIVAPRGGHGKFFIDLYEVSSGRRFASIEGEMHDTLRADLAVALTFWLESRYFIVQLGSHLERMLVCEVPTNRR
jgi:hypothetical protein